MLTRHILCILISLLPFLLNSCGAVQTYSWVAFTDSLETGSKVKPSKVLVTLKGDVKVVMTKASDPDSLQGQFKWLRAKQTQQEMP